MLRGTERAGCTCEVGEEIDARAAGGSTASRIARTLLFAIGLAVAAWLVHAAGLQRVVDALRRAGPWFPAIVFAESAILLTDVAAMRSLLGDVGKAVTLAAWVRSSALSYAAATVLPAGRAAGEAVRAAALAECVGPDRAVFSCAQLQTATLFGNTVASVCASLVIANGSESVFLVRALVVNAAACAVLGALLLALLRSDRIRGFASKVFARYVSGLPPRRGAERPSLGFAALLYCVLGRVLQAAQYGIVVHAMGGRVNVHSAVVAQGVHLVGAMVGDVIPGHVGAMEGVYRAFADALSLPAASAISIALLMRLAQLFLAAACFVVSSIPYRTTQKSSPSDR